MAALVVISLCQAALVVLGTVVLVVLAARVLREGRR
jgi:hypothetical protein